MGNVITGRFPPKKGMKVAPYARDINATRDLPYAQKFTEFLKLCNDAAIPGTCDAVLVAFPEVLGDDYDELVTNLSRAAEAGLLVTIAGSTATVGGDAFIP